MEGQARAFDEIADLMDAREMDFAGATLVAAMMRKPARAEALKDWMSKHPQATNIEVKKQAQKIAVTVEPTIKHK